VDRVEAEAIYDQSREVVVGVLVRMDEQIRRLEEHAARQDERIAELKRKLNRIFAADLDTLRGKLRAALNDSTPARAKTTLQSHDPRHPSARTRQHQTDLPRARGSH
jgi:hypothetical protein